MAGAGVPGPRYTGWWTNPSPNSSGAGRGTTQSYYVNGTKVADFSAALQSVVGALAASTLVTGATGLVATAGDVKATAGNFRAGALSAFGTTEPTSALVMKAGTAPVGAVATSGGIFSTATVVQKIIAAGTVSNVET